MANYDYDVIIVGAGPAGTSTARFINPIKNQLKVLIIDRKKKIGLPIQCGEAISKKSSWKAILPDGYSLDGIFDIPKQLIANEIEYIDMISPFKTKCRYSAPGIVLYRDLFDQYLAKLAEANGAEIKLNTRMKELKNNHTVVTSNGEISGNIIVGADGPKSRIANSLRMRRPNTNIEFASCMFHLVKGDFHSNVKEMYFGKRFSGGYGWVFPKGDSANIGLGTLWNTKQSLRSILKKFLIDLGFSSNDIIYTRGGLIPMSGPLPTFVNRNILLVGDAAGMVFPSNGGGIITAMIAGRECGISISDFFKKGTPLSSYENSWKGMLGKIIEQSLKEKNKYLWLTKHDILLDIAFRLLKRRIVNGGSYFP